VDGYGEDLAAIHAARVHRDGAGRGARAARAAAAGRPRPRARLRYRRAEETHRLRLHRPADVLAGLRRAGFSARTLRGGYAGAGLPPGLTGYLGRLRQSVSSVTMRTRW
jgi:hypothetical protein